MRFILVFLYALITLGLTSHIAMALDPENRVLLSGKQTDAGRGPAEAGLESGRYQEVDAKDLKTWQEKRKAVLDEETAKESTSGLSRARGSH